MSAPSLEFLDPFDLPEWLGQEPVTWRAERGVREGHLVHGELSAGERRHPCDLLAVDEAYPRPVADDASRARVHQAWRRDQVELVDHEGRLTLAVPGAGFTADGILDALSRLAKALGAPQEHLTALMRLGD